MADDSEKAKGALGEKVENARNAFVQLVKFADQQALDLQKQDILLADVVEDFKSRLFALEGEADGFLKRREELLNRDELTAGESEELALLKELTKQIEAIKFLILEFAKDFELDKEVILRTGDLRLIFDLKETYGFTNAEIIIAAEWGYELEDETLKLLSGLIIDDEELENICNSKPYAAPCILKYCNLKPNQREFIFKGIVSGKYDWNVFDLLFVDLPKKVQEYLIKGIESGKGEMFEGINKEVAAMDLISSPWLDDRQKRRLLVQIVKHGDAREIDYHLKKYPQLFTPQMRKSAEVKRKQDKVKPILKIPDIYDAVPEDFVGKKLRFVTHPFFLLFGSAQDWIREIALKDLGEGGKAYAEGAILNLMNYAIANRNPRIYVAALDFLTEYERYGKVAEEQDSVTVFLFPKIYSGKLTKKEKAYLETMASFFASNKGNVFYLRTATHNTGFLERADKRALGEVLPKDAQISLTGGYLSLCLAHSAQSLVSMEPYRKLSFDYSEAYPETYALSEEELKAFNLPEINWEGRFFAMKSLSDVRRFVADNKTFNRAYKDAIFSEYAVNDLKKFPFEYRWKKHVANKRPNP